MCWTGTDLVSAPDKGGRTAGGPGQGLDRKVLEKKVTLSSLSLVPSLPPACVAIGFPGCTGRPRAGLPAPNSHHYPAHAPLLLRCGLQVPRWGLWGAGSGVSLTGKKPAPAQVCPSGPSTSQCESSSLLRPSPSPATLLWTRLPSCSGMQAARPSPSTPSWAAADLLLPGYPGHLGACLYLGDVTPYSHMPSGMRVVSILLYILPRTPRSETTNPRH